MQVQPLCSIFPRQGPKFNFVDSRGRVIGDDQSDVRVQKHQDIGGALEFRAIGRAEIRLGTPLRAFHVKSLRIESGSLKPEPGAKV